MLRVFCTRISDLSDERILRNMLPFLTKERTEKINKYCRNEDKLRSAVSELLLRYGYYLIKKSSDIPFFKIAFGEYGKPRFVGCDEPEFNLSHAGNYVACVFADCEVGIDIEIFSKMNNLNISKNYFTNVEHQFIIGDKMSSLRRFYYIWTLKESYIKEIGIGLYKALNSFSVELHDETYKVFEDGVQQKVYMRLWDHYQDMCVSICAAGNEDEVQNLSIEWILFEQLMDFFGIS